MITGTYHPGQAPPAQRIEVWGIAWLGNDFLDAHALQDFLDRDPQRWKQLTGDFICVYWGHDGSCHLCRPLTGARMLYYRHDTALQWSMDITTLVDTASFDAIDTDLLAAITCAAEPDPERTPYRAVRCLRAGQCLTLYPSGTVTMTYDDFRWEDHRRLSLVDAAAHYRTLCAQAVRRACTGKSRIGLLLSGGLDSAIIAYEASRAGCHVEGFHWTWNLAPLAHERRVAAQLAEHLGIALHFVDTSATLAPDGEYLAALSHTPLPYYHAFLASYRATATAANQHDLATLCMGHLGDTLFQSTPADGVRAKLHQRQYVGAVTDLIGRDGYRDAAATFWSWWHPSPGVTGGVERIARTTWLTPSARAQALATGQYRYSLPQRGSASTREVFQAIMTGINQEAYLDDVRLQTALTPSGVHFTHPYLDRALIEFCLSLDSTHRAQNVGGHTISKPLARWAYLGDLPADVIRREVRAPYAAINEQYSVNNREALADLFGRHSCLVQLEIADWGELARLFADPHHVQQSAKSLVRAAGVELWLRHLAGRDWHPPTAPCPRWVGFATHAEDIALAPQVRGYTVQRDLVLLHQTRGEVLQLDEITHLFLSLVPQRGSIEGACAALQEILEESVDQASWCAAYEHLVAQGWLRKGQEHAIV